MEYISTDLRYRLFIGSTYRLNRVAALESTGVARRGGSSDSGGGESENGEDASEHVVR